MGADAASVTVSEWEVFTHDVNRQSVILNQENMETIHQWWSTLKRLKLLYRATDHGMTAADFHARCDGAARTLVVAKSTSGFVFGGYSGETAWKSSGNSQSVGAFLFRLAGPEGVKPSRHMLLQPRNSAALYFNS